MTYRVSKLAIGGSLLLLPLLACSGNPTAEEVVDQSAPVICDKAKSCFGDATFNAAYPGGTSECVTKAKDSAKSKYGGDITKSSTCTDEEVTKCLNDFKAAACKADKSPPDVPCNC